MRSSRMRFRMALGSLLTAAIVWSWATSAAAADDHITGVVTARVDSNTVWVQTEGIGRILVTVSEGTDVRETSGVIRRKTASAEELIPGLQVSVDGKYETPDKFIAKRVTFSKEAREIAGAIRAGVTAANDQRLIATSGRSNLDNLTSVKTITVYFANGKYDVSKAHKAQLEELAAQAHGLPGYVISVAAYTSAVGSGPLNQRLSRQRADAVTTILNQAGVPLMNVLVPAAMSVSEQVAPNTTAKGQAENRRAVVTLLHNKGVAGHQ